MYKELITIIVCSILIVVITAVIALFTVDYKRAKSGRKAYLWVRNEPKRKNK